MSQESNSQSEDYVVQNREIQYEDDESSQEKIYEQKAQIEHFESDDNDDIDQQQDIQEQSPKKKRLRKIQNIATKKRIKKDQDYQDFQVQDDLSEQAQQTDSISSQIQEQKKTFLRVNLNNKKIKQNQENGQVIFQNQKMISDRIIIQMEDAYLQDRSLNDQQKPAIKKLVLSQQIISHLKQPYVQNSFLINKGLDIIEKWIEKMPDGSKPSQIMKKQIVEILNCLNFESDFIPNSQLGKFLMQIYKNDSKTENNEIRKLSKQVIDKWSRTMLNNKINYQKIDNYDDEDLKEQNKQKLKISNKNQKINLFAEQNNDRYVKIPAQKQFDFVVNPKSDIPIDYRNKEISEQSKDIYRLLLNRKKSKNK